MIRSARGPGRRSAASRSTRRTPARRGAALVEFAMVLPILIMVILGMLEIGRGVMATEVLAHAARTGARNGSLQTGTTSSVTTAVTDLLTAAGVNGATVTVTVNGGASEVGNAKAGDKIKVVVTVPYSKVTWIGNPQYLAGKNLSGECTMRREG